MVADRLDAEDAVVVFAGDNADEAAVVAAVHRERAAVGGEGERAYDCFFAFLRCLLRRQARCDDFGFGEADGGDRDGVEAGAKVVATGGYGSLIASASARITEFDPHLTMRGLGLLYARNGTDTDLADG